VARKIRDLFEADWLEASGKDGKMAKVVRLTSRQTAKAGGRASAARSRQFA
jgi:hypothetical protein